jgi:MFS family permease
VAHLPRLARYTWARQWPCAALEGLALGVVGLASFAVKRSLGGREDAVPLLIALWQVLWIAAPAAGVLLARADPQRLFRVVAVCAFAPVLAIGLVGVEPAALPGHGRGNLALFIALMFLHYAAAVAFVPHRGALLRANYAPAVRGRVFGLLAAIVLLGQGVGAKVAGILLDRDPRWLRAIFPAAAVLGVLGYWQLGRIRWRRQHRARREHAGDGLSAAIWRAVRNAWTTLRKDRAFRVYEIAFMLYGLGFLGSVGLLVLYCEGELRLSYDEWTWAAFVVFPLAQTAAIPAFGRLSDRIGVVRTSAVAFTLLAVFFLLVPQVRSLPALGAAYVIWGVAMAGVNIGWNLGPLHFAPEGRAHVYTSLHFSMVGIRSVLAPWLGYLVKSRVSYTAAFALSAGLAVAAALTMWRLAVSLGPCTSESSSPS